MKAEPTIHANRNAHFGASPSPPDAPKNIAKAPKPNPGIQRAGRMTFMRKVARDDIPRFIF